MNHANTIAITGYLGSVGKTYTAYCVALGLAKQNHKVLLIDADPQSDLTDIVLKKHPNPDSIIHQGTTNTLLTTNQPIQNQISTITHLGNSFDFIPSTVDLASYDYYAYENSLHQNKDILKNLLEPIQKEYDYIILDNTPSFGPLHLQVVQTSSSLLLPILYFGEDTVEYIQNYYSMIQEIFPSLLKSTYCFYTLVESDNTNKVKTMHLPPQLFLRTFIPKDDNLGLSLYNGENPYFTIPDSSSIKAYQELLKDFLSLNS